MNNNNRNSNNNRRRGRGNNRQQGGGQQLNRIDSRARGNAPQLLEKYRKLAHDAHLNGDRVQEEYFLQFADHYFRVLADQRARQEEQRGPRREDRWQEGGEAFREEGEDSGEYAAEGEFQPYERQTANREEREDRGNRRPRHDRSEPREDERDAERAAELAPSEEAETPASVFEPAENPFVRGSRGLRPRRQHRPRRHAGDAPLGLDPASLPPPISASRDLDDRSGEAAESEVAEVPRRRTRRPRPPVDDAGETLEVAE